jgi:hypothetical protein
MTRTACRWCTAPLSAKQIMRRKTYCSRSCAKTHWHAMHPDGARRAFAKGWATNRQRFIERLRVTLKSCKTLGDAYRLGHHNGYTLAMERMRRRKAAA